MSFMWTLINRIKRSWHSNKGHTLMYTCHGNFSLALCLRLCFDILQNAREFSLAFHRKKLHRLSSTSSCFKFWRGLCFFDRKLPINFSQKFWSKSLVIPTEMHQNPENRAKISFKILGKFRKKSPNPWIILQGFWNPKNLRTKIFTHCNTAHAGFRDLFGSGRGFLVKYILQSLIGDIQSTLIQV